MDQKSIRRRFAKSVLVDTDRLMLLEGETPFDMKAEVVHYMGMMNRCEKPVDPE